MLESSPPISCLAVLNKIHLISVSDCNATFMCWDTEFSSDVDTSMVEDNREKKLDYFQEMKKVFNFHKVLSEMGVVRTIPMSEKDILEKIDQPTT